MWTSRLYLPGETLFGAVAERSLQLGWTIIPQERGAKRISAKIDGRSLRWGEFIERMPTPAETRHWCNQAPGANGAILLGMPSGNVFCYDIDVSDAELSLAIQHLAEEKLGYTRFARQGQPPKMALFYRVAREEDLPPNKSFKFVDSEDMLEVQARGKLVTAFGYHHKTDRYFEWEGPQPSTHRVDEVPLVTPAQHAEFTEAVQQLRAFTRRPDAKAGDGIVFEGDGSLEVSREGWTIPRVFCDAAKIVDGKVVDGRKQWLSAMVFALVRFNPERAAASTSALIDVAMGIAAERIDNRGNPIDIRSTVVSKANRDADNLRRGQIHTLPVVKEKDGKRIAPARGVLPSTNDPALSHLPAADKRKSLEIAGRTVPDATKAAARAIITDRTEIAADVSSQLGTSIGVFLDEVYSKEHAPTVHVLRVPTGGGKTSRTAHYIAHDPRTFLPLEGPDCEPSGPILFLLPTYNNIDEVRSRADAASLDPSLPDAELAAQAAALGLMTLEEAKEAIDELRADAEGTGLETMVYKGKIAAGCKFAERVQALMDAGISSSGLCYAKTKSKTTGETDEKWCQFYGECEAITQRQRIKESHVVFLPHAFLNLTIPEELSNARAVIADERIFTLATHVGLMKMSTLELPRNPPPLTKLERKAALATEGIVEPIDEGNEVTKARAAKVVKAAREAFLQDREDASHVAIKAMRAGDCPAAVLAKHKEGKWSGADLVAAAARVCGASSTSNVIVYPGMPDHAFADLVATPTGTEIKLEYRFWRILEDRIKTLADGTARQAREMRIQRRLHEEGETTTEYVRLSWRSELNWPRAPLLLLDASAAERIVAKVFPDRAVVMHDIQAPLNLKTVLLADRSRSTRSLTPDSDIASADAIAQARNVERVRAVENMLATVHANGRMVVGMAKRVREILRHEYLPLPNVDDLHFGAERGLNFAETHVAALALGRMELPTWVLDAYAAAFAHDDTETFVLLDPRGDGMLEDGEPLKPVLVPQVLPMRDGSDTTLEVPMAPEGSWQRVVQVQFREESIRQFAGRLRPVYREDTPMFYIASQCVPSGIIIDDIAATDDLIPACAPLLDASRSHGGILDPQRLNRERPDLGTLQQFTDWFLALPAQLKAGFHAVRVGKKSVGIPAHYADPLAVAAAAYPDVEELALIRAASNVRVAPAGERPADAIELALGSRDQRAEAEASARERAIEWLTERHKADTTQLPYLPGRGRYAVGVDKDRRPVILGLSSIALLTRPDPDKAVTDEVAPAPTGFRSPYVDDDDMKIAL
jgi:hypothetical protein